MLLILLILCDVMLTTISIQPLSHAVVRLVEATLCDL